RRGRKPRRLFARRVAGTGRHFPDLHRGSAVAAARPVRSKRVKGPLLIAAVVAALATVPLFVHSNVVFNFLVVTLLIALTGQGWNIVGGYGGQYSFGHAAFFGTGAYVTAILQMRYGLNAWMGFVAGIAAGAAVGAIIGGPAFRAGLRSSYFAL